MRINIENFIKQTDNPQKKIFVLDDDESFIEINGLKVYHIHLIIRYKIDKKHYHKHFRIIINRNGIQKIESVV